MSEEDIKKTIKDKAYDTTEEELGKRVNQI